MSEKNNIKNKKIIAITGCAAGIAHTFMAAEGIENAAKELGAAKVKVETHGTAGPDNVLTAKDIREADLVIIAADIAVDPSRFVGKELYQTGTHLAVAKPKVLLEEAFAGATKFRGKELKKSSSSKSAVADTGNIEKKSYVVKHLMYALSWMIPLVIAGGLIMAIGNIFAMQPGWIDNTGLGWKGVVVDQLTATAGGPGVYLLQNNVTPEIQALIDSGRWFKIDGLDKLVSVVGSDGIFYSNVIDWMAAGGASILEWGKVWSFAGREFFGTLQSSGGAVMSLIYPVLAAGIAYSIAGKLSFAPAFLGGWLYNDPNFIKITTNDGSVMGLGFLGALAVGFIIGYITLAVRKIKIHRSLKGICDLMLWPLLMSLFIIIIGKYAIGIVLSYPVEWIYNGINALSNSSAGSLVLGAIVAAMICVDLGGPINKTAMIAANTIWIASMSGHSNPADWNFVAMSATQAAISIPPLAAFFSVVIFPKFFTTQEITLGTNASVMGLVGITEGSIPFAVAKPKAFIPANIVGGAVSGLLVTAFGFQFYGGLGSPLAGLLGYVPSTVIHNYALSSVVWALSIIGSALISTGIIFLIVFSTAKKARQNRLISEAKSAAKFEIKQAKLKNDEAKMISLKEALKLEIENIRKDAVVHYDESKEIKHSELEKEKTSWLKEKETLNDAIIKEKEINNEKIKEKILENITKIKEDFAKKIEVEKQNTEIETSEVKENIKTLKLNRKELIEKTKLTNKYTKAKYDYKMASKKHKNNLSMINTNFINEVS